MSMQAFDKINAREIVAFRLRVSLFGRPVLQIQRRLTAAPGGETIGRTPFYDVREEEIGEVNARIEVRP